MGQVLHHERGRVRGLDLSADRLRGQRNRTLARHRAYVDGPGHRERTSCRSGNRQRGPAGGRGTPAPVAASGRARPRRELTESACKASSSTSGGASKAAIVHTFGGGLWPPLFSSLAVPRRKDLCLHHG